MHVVANAGRLAVLAVPAVLAVGAVRARVVRDVGAAVHALNVYTMYVGFPSLVVLGILGVEASAARSWGFWLVVPLADLVFIAVARLIGQRLPGHQAGSIALVLLFGNTAYLGLPFAVSVLGERARGPASLLVACQVAIAVVGGPALLARWSGDEATGLDLGRLARQPLLWAPLAGVVLRLLPIPVRGAARDLVAPVAASASPVAMFLLGLYVAATLHDVRRADAGVWVHVVLRLVAAPLVTAGLVVALHRAGAISGEAAAVSILLAGTPAAIGTFSIAFAEGVAADRVAQVVVRSSLASALSLPILATLVAPLAGWR